MGNVPKYHQSENAKQISETFKKRTEEKEESFAEENTELRAKMEYHELAIEALRNTLENVTEKNNNMHTEININIVLRSLGPSGLRVQKSPSASSIRVPLRVMGLSFQYFPN